MANFYTGIGSRETPSEFLDCFARLGRQLELAGWTLRSGGAWGADSAFDAGIESQHKEIYLPWKNFNQRDGIIPGKDLWEQAARHASEVHPTWKYLTPGAKKLHTRNVFQILGQDLATPSAFVLCWTQDGCESEATRTVATGGTGTAIALADRHDIEVINFFNPNGLERLAAKLACIQTISKAEQPVPDEQDRPKRNAFAHLQKHCVEQLQQPSTRKYAP